MDDVFRDVHLLATRLRGLVEHLGDRCVLRHEGGEDGRELTLEGEKAFGEGGGRHLHPPLVRRVDLQVVPIRSVQPKYTVLLPRVERKARHGAESRRLHLPQRSELAAPLQDKLGRCGHDARLARLRGAGVRLLVRTSELTSLRLRRVVRAASDLVLRSPPRNRWGGRDRGRGGHVRAWEDGGHRRGCHQWSGRQGG